MADSVSENPPDFLRLPHEILTKILRPCLQHTEEQVNRLSYPGVLKRKPDGPGQSYALTSFDKPATGEELQPQLLRVCKRFNEVGTSLLYANTLVYTAPTPYGWSREKITKAAREYVRLLNYEPRDDAHRLKKVQITIPTPDHYSRLPRETDGELFDEICAGFALHQPVWEDVLFGVLDMSAPAVYNIDSARCERLIYGLGRLHAKEVMAGCNKVASEDMEWAIKNPHHTMPLFVLHHDLMDYLNLYDPDQTSSTERQETASLRKEVSFKAFLKKESFQASRKHDEETFYLVLEMGVEYVKTMVSAALGGDIKPLYGRQNILETATEQGDRLLSAKDGEWKAGYTIPPPPNPRRARRYTVCRQWDLHT